MLHVWYIHLHDWVMFRVNVRKEYSTMEHLEYYYLEFALFVLDQTNSEKVFGLLGPPNRLSQDGGAGSIKICIPIIRIITVPSGKLT